MVELLDVLDAFTTPLKVAWMMWLAWGVGQIFWYRRECRPAAATKRPAPVRKPFVTKASVPEALVTRLVTPQHVIAEPVVHPPVVKPPLVEPPFVERAPALLEEGDTVAELDRFVADFEMNTRHRRERPHNGDFERDWLAR